MPHDKPSPKPPPTNEGLLVWLNRPGSAANATDVTRSWWLSKGIRAEYYDGWLRLARERAGVRQPDLFGR